ncbi:uncharacterized protein LOC131165271 isoform X2 [Malania oleifera]|uniref:uncharacterized protein LOC131165271 isoform X2 n=1 Tax=Malania oleifera TaxID=397392 RepID=UPI0025ADAB5E|nr:uncharacterized protein LOC131165271 isoform X2 [Malania oleifera]
MADFPPNLDDGESWLPSDIRREISFVDVECQSKRAASINNIARFRSPQLLVEPANGFSTNFTRITPKPEICNGLLSPLPIKSGTVHGIGVPVMDQSLCMSWNGGCFHTVSGPNPACYTTAPTSQSLIECLDIRGGGSVLVGQQKHVWPVRQMNGGMEASDLASTYPTGTGVFLPRGACSLKNPEKTAAGITSVEDPQATKKMISPELGISKEPKSSQFPSEILLPQDWMY